MFSECGPCEVPAGAPSFVELSKAMVMSVRDTALEGRYALSYRELMGRMDEWMMERRTCSVACDWKRV